METIDYRVKTETRNFCGYELRIQSLQSLDETIDQVFEHLEKTGNPELLQVLCPYFGVIWPSALALAEAVADAIRQGEFRKEERRLEIGCGLGIPSLLLASAGFPVTATDFHPEVRRFLEQNIALNGITGLTYENVDWKESDFRGERFDWIIGSDILYERTHPDWVAATLDRLLARNGRAIIADPARPYLQPFADEMNRLGFVHETRIRTVQASDGIRDIFTLHLKRRT